MTPRERAAARLSAMSPLPNVSATIEALEAALVEAEELRDRVAAWEAFAQRLLSTARGEG